MEYEVVKVQARKSGSFMVTIPKEMAEKMSLKGGEHLKVYIEEINDKKVLIYEKLSE